MRFHALLTVRDEVDVIDRCLAHLRSWADTVFVFDTGSTDGTWRRITRAAARDRGIVALERRPVLFNEGGVRGHVFERARPAFAAGDWICRADADEVYLADPRAFVRTRLRRGESVVAARQYVFGMTRAEARRWRPDGQRDRAGGGESVLDRARPLEDRRTRFVMDEYPEVRFFRYRPSMVWPVDRSMPALCGLLAAARIPMRHDRYRDPPQMRQRAALRSIIAERFDGVGAHWSERDWRAGLLPNRARTMRAGDPLPAVPEPDPRAHLGSPMRRAVRVAFYRAGLARLGDRFYARRSGGLVPLPRDVQRALTRRPGLRPRAARGGVVVPENQGRPVVSGSAGSDR